MGYPKEINFYPLIIELFTQKTKKEIERLVFQTFDRYLPVKGKRIEIQPNNIKDLEEIFSELKALFPSPGISVLPFSIIPEGHAHKNFLRPGRIYLHPDEKDKFEKVLGDLAFLVKLLPWQGLYELEIPATTLPKLLFLYRDLMLVGLYRPCLHCGLPWHKTASCPGRKERSPARILLEFLHQPLQAIAQKLNQAFEHMKANREFLDQLSLRYYYFQPAFLRILFTTNAKAWEGLNIFKKEVMVSGGNIFLGLDALLAGQLDEAFRRFEAVSQERGDWRASLGQAFVAIDKEDMIEAIYYVENALGLEEHPLVQGYLLLLKGWLFENRGDLLKAEEAYREALRRDRTNLPAQFHLRLLMIRYGLWDEVFQYLPLIYNDPLGFLLSFLEPKFLPIAPQVEEALENIFRERQSQAAGRLAVAENKLRPIIKLLPEAKARELNQDLEDLRQRIYKGGYFDFLWAEEQARLFSLEAEWLLYRHIQEVREQFNALYQRYQEYETFWRTKGQRDREFKNLLEDFSSGLKEVERLINVDTEKNLRVCVKKLKDLEGQSEEIKKAQAELLARLKFRKQLRVFIQTFLFLETMIFFVFLFFPKILYIWFPTVEKAIFFSPITFLEASIFVLLISIFRAITQKD